ncbi:MAG TPA: hypothetical protein VKT32_16030 [Chthonomonadaceae bacterium]|nr:hypothetical protein [Chthonomonadaceae bacterium]
MSRVVSRTYVRSKEGAGMGIAEWIVIIAFGVALYAGVRYYINYRHGPTYALSSFLGAIKAGSVENQYSLIDESDKQNYYPTLSDYDKNCPLAHGYTERIESFTLTDSKIDPKHTTIAKIDSTETVRALSGSQSKDLLNAESQTYTDHYTLHKDSKGDWKIWLSHSNLGMTKATPNPPGDFIGNG